MSDAPNGGSELVLPPRMNPSPLRQMPTSEVSPLALVQMAVQRGDSIETITQLVALAERMQANQARMAFVEAMAQFKRNPPKILKDKHVSFQTSKGVTEYDHARIGTVCAAIVKGLSEVGISHRWDLKQGEGGRVTVTCILTHVNGHSESTPLSSSPDDSGGKNNIQAIASATTYLQRYTLLAATGLATNDMPDDDGRGTSAPEPLTEDHLATLEALMDEVQADEHAFLTYMTGLSKVTCNELADIPDKCYPEAVAALQAKRRAAKKGAGK